VTGLEALLERSISASNERLSRIEHLVEHFAQQALNDDLVELRLTVVAEDHQQAAEERAVRQATIALLTCSVL